jgi:hypothetical protein
VPEKAKSRRYSAAYKKRILEEYEQLDKAGKGALLRREGLYSSLITNWRQQREKGALQALGVEPGRPKTDPGRRDEARAAYGAAWPWARRGESTPSSNAACASSPDVGVHLSSRSRSIDLRRSFTGCSPCLSVRR